MKAKQQAFMTTPANIVNSQSTVEFDIIIVFKSDFSIIMYSDMENST